METVYDAVMGWRLDQQHKHDLGSKHAEDQIDSMSHHDFLLEISEAIEKRFAAEKAQ